ncbi:MAG TPA: hypothetical protein VHA80_06635 [Solirubrobacterales bacterium]|nr:hypothetical protein [Solirubrobacterales bacterium]
MNMQEKFQAAMQKIADERDLDLVVERTYANSGWYSFQPRAGFDPVLRFGFNFLIGYSEFLAGGCPDLLVLDPRDGRWNHVEGGQRDLLVAAVRSVLDGGPGTLRIVVLPDGETYGPLEGSRVCEIPSWFDAEAIEEALAQGSLEGREPR